MRTPGLTWRGIVSHLMADCLACLSFLSLCFLSDVESLQQLFMIVGSLGQGGNGNQAFWFLIWYLDYLQNAPGTCINEEMLLGLILDKKIKYFYMKSQPSLLSCFLPISGPKYTAEMGLLSFSCTVLDKFFSVHRSSFWLSVCLTRSGRRYVQ